MCMNCGCMEPNDRHGNQSNITLDDLRQAGEANGQDLSETVQHIEQTLQSSGETGFGGTSSTGGMGSRGSSGSTQGY